jgi:hypothetical protein
MVVGGSGTCGGLWRPRLAPALQLLKNGYKRKCDAKATVTSSFTTRTRKQPSHYHTPSTTIINRRITIQRVLPDGSRTAQRVRSNRRRAIGHRRRSLRNTVTNVIIENQQRIDLSNAAEQLAAELGAGYR